MLYLSCCCLYVQALLYPTAAASTYMIKLFESDRNEKFFYSNKKMSRKKFSPFSYSIFYFTESFRALLTVKIVDDIDKKCGIDDRWEAAAAYYHIGSQSVSE